MGFEDLKKIVEWATTEDQLDGPSDGITPLSKKKFEIMVSEVEALIEMMQPQPAAQTQKKSLNQLLAPRQNSFVSSVVK